MSASDFVSLRHKSCLHSDFRGWGSSLWSRTLRAVTPRLSKGLPFQTGARRDEGLEDTRDFTQQILQLSTSFLLFTETFKMNQ